MVYHRFKVTFKFKFKLKFKLEETSWRSDETSSSPKGQSEASTDSTDTQAVATLEAVKRFCNEMRSDEK